jgi:hypothetical protein
MEAAAAKREALKARLLLRALISEAEQFAVD